MQLMGYDISDRAERGGSAAAAVPRVYVWLRLSHNDGCNARRMTSALVWSHWAIRLDKVTTVQLNDWLHAYQYVVYDDRNDISKHSVVSFNVEAIIIYLIIINLMINCVDRRQRASNAVTRRIDFAEKK